MGRQLARRIVIWSVLAAVLAGAVWLAVAVPGSSWVLTGWSGFPIVGAVILSSRPGNWIGRLLLWVGIVWVATSILLAPGIVERIPAGLEAMVFAASAVVWIALMLIVLLFPNGRIETPLGRWVALAVAAVSVLMTIVVAIDPRPLQLSGRTSPWAVPAAGPVTEWFLGPGFLAVPLLMAVALLDLVLRARREHGTARLPFRWLGYGVAVTMGFLLQSLIWPDDSELAGLVALGPLILNAIPVCIGIAVTRHGLYEIGRVVSRTVSYVVVTALVVAVYALVVTLASRLVPDQSTLAVAAATLAAAGVFLPVLRRVQRLIDRRFDRERYDAAQVVDAFGERLRSSVNPDATADDLLRAVEHTLQPSAAGIWTAGGEVR